MEVLDLKDVPLVVKVFLHGIAGDYCYLGSSGDEEVYYLRPREFAYTGFPMAAFYNPETYDCRLSTSKEDREIVFDLLEEAFGCDEDEDDEEDEALDDEDEDLSCDEEDPAGQPR